MSADQIRQRGLGLWRVNEIPITSTVLVFALVQCDAHHRAMYCRHPLIDGVSNQAGLRQSLIQLSSTHWLTFG